MGLVFATCALEVVCNSTNPKIPIHPVFPFIWLCNIITQKCSGPEANKHLLCSGCMGDEFGWVIVRVICRECGLENSKAGLDSSENLFSYKSSDSNKCRFILEYEKKLTLN